MITTGSDMKWLGPRRAVRQRHIFPACSACWLAERERPGFLYEALCGFERLPDVTPPGVVIRGVIRGGGRGDGRPRGVLRVIRTDREDRET